MRALWWCSGVAVPDESVDWQKMDVDMAAYNARRVFRDHDMLQDLMRQYSACTAARPDLFANEPSALAAWRKAFVENSMAYAEENRAHAALAAQGELCEKPSKRLRFSDQL